MWIYQLSSTVLHNDVLIENSYLVQHTTIEYSVSGCLVVFSQMSPVDISLEIKIT